MCCNIAANTNMQPKLLAECKKWQWDVKHDGTDWDAAGHLGAADAVTESSIRPTFSQTTKLQPVILL